MRRVSSVNNAFGVLLAAVSTLQLGRQLTKVFSQLQNILIQ